MNGFQGPETGWGGNRVPAVIETLATGEASVTPLPGVSVEHVPTSTRSPGFNPYYGAVPFGNSIPSQPPEASPPEQWLHDALQTVHDVSV